MNLKLEIGKYYKDKTGNISGPMEKLEFPIEKNLTFQCGTNTFRTFTSEGKWFPQEDGSRNSILDLVEECDSEGNPVEANTECHPPIGPAKIIESIEDNNSATKLNNIIGNNIDSKRRRNELAEKILLAIVEDGSLSDFCSDEDFKDGVGRIFKLADTFIAESEK